MSLVAHQIDVIQSEPRGSGGDVSGIHAGYAPGIQKIGMNHNHTDDGAQEKVASKSPGGTDGDQNGQEYESRVAEQMDDRIGSGFRHGRPYIGQTFQQSHKKSAGDDGRNNGNKNITQRLDGTLKRILLFGCRLLHFVFAGLADAGQFDELVVNLIDRAGTEDDLKLSCRFKHSFYSFDILQGFFAALFVVCDHQAQSGGTVCGGNNIFPAADMVADFSRCFSIIHDFSLLHFKI